MEPLVSIVIPSLNQGEYIEKTIKSVLDQDYHRMESLVVDGGSTDNTLAILKKYEEKIKWISEKDKGQADAINKGIAMTEGEIVAWLNSDDVYLPGAISRVVNYFRHWDDVKMVYGKSSFIDAAGAIVGRYPTEPFDFKRLASFNFISQPSVFFKREAFYAVGGLNPNLHYALDYDLWIRIGSNFRVGYFPESLSGYRLHDTSKTVAYQHALKNHKETLAVTRQYYHWAPANRVYSYYYHAVEEKLPHCLKKVRPLTIAVSLLIAALKYFQLNKGLRLEDIKSFSLKNIKKIWTPWKDLYKSY